MFRSRRIKLDPEMTDTQIPQTLMHEAIHTLGDAYEIVEWSRHKTDNDGKHIDKIDLMATALTQFIRHNPELVKWIQDNK